MPTTVDGDDSGPAYPERRLGGNVVWSLLGQGAPIVVALVSIPILAGSLGPNRFGLLALSWTFIGYFSVFDLGLTTAMERSVASQLAARDDAGIHATVWTTLAVLLGLGLVGLVGVWLAAPAIVHALRAPSGLQGEAVQTMHLLALSIPLVITSVGLRGVLAAHMRFKLISATGIPLGVWTYVGPILVLPVSHSLVPIVAMMIVGRIGGFILYGISCLRVVPSLRSITFRRSLLRPLLTFGGWLALDDFVDPLTNFLDRFLIGSMVSVAAVAFYSVPFQLAAQGWILATAMSGVLLPIFSGGLMHNREYVCRIFHRSITSLVLVMFPVALLMIGLARPGVQIWLGSAYATQSAVVLQIVAAGVLVTSVGSIGSAFNAGIGRPDVDAKLAIMKFALHFGPIWWVLPRFGIVGLAALWMASASAEAVGMVVYALRAQGVTWTSIARRAVNGVAMTLLLVIAAVGLPAGAKVAYLAAVIMATGAVGWRSVLTPGGRRMVRARLGLKPMAHA